MRENGLFDGDAADDFEIAVVTRGPSRWFGSFVGVVAVAIAGWLIVSSFTDGSWIDRSSSDQASADEDLPTDTDEPIGEDDDDVLVDPVNGGYSIAAARMASELWTSDTGWTFFDLDDWQRLLDQACSEEFWTAEGANRLVQTHRLDRGTPSMRANFAMMTVLAEVCPADDSFEPSAAILDFGVSSYPLRVAVEVAPGDVVLSGVEQPDRSGYVMYRVRPGAVGDQAWPIAVVARSGQQPNVDDLSFADRKLPVLAFEPQLPLRVLLPDWLTATAFSSTVQLRFCPLTVNASCVDVDATAGPGLSAMPSQAPPTRSNDVEPVAASDDALRVWVAETGWTALSAAEWLEIAERACDGEGSNDALREMIEDSSQRFRGSSIERAVHTLWAMTGVVCPEVDVGDEPPRGEDPLPYRGFVEFGPGGAVIMPHGTTATGAAPAVSLYFRPSDSESTEPMIELAVLTAASFSTDTASLPQILPPGIYRLCPHYEAVRCPQYLVADEQALALPED